MTENPTSGGGHIPPRGIYDPRDYAGGPDRYEEPPLPGDDEWNGPEDDDEDDETRGGQYEIEFERYYPSPEQIDEQGEPTDEVASYLRHPANGSLRVVRECGHRFPHRRCRYCGDDV